MNASLLKHKRTITALETEAQELRDKMVESKRRYLFSFSNCLFVMLFLTHFGLRFSLWGRREARTHETNMKLLNRVHEMEAALQSTQAENVKLSAELQVKTRALEAAEKEIANVPEFLRFSYGFSQLTLFV